MLSQKDFNVLDFWNVTYTTLWSDYHNIIYLRFRVCSRMNMTRYHDPETISRAWKCTRNLRPWSKPKSVPGTWNEITWNYISWKILLSLCQLRQICILILTIKPEQWLVRARTSPHSSPCHQSYMLAGLYFMPASRLVVTSAQLALWIEPIHVQGGTRVRVDVLTFPVGDFRLPVVHACALRACSRARINLVVVSVLTVNAGDRSTIKPLITSRRYNCGTVLY